MLYNTHISERREHMDFKLIKNETKNAIRGNWFMLLLAIIVAGAITSASATIGIGFLLSPILSGGIYILIKKLIKDKKFDFNFLFSFFSDLNHAIKLIGVVFLTGLIVVGGFLLLIIPGIIFAYQYSQAIYVMADNPEMTIWDAMKKSKELMVGYKFDLFIFQLSFIGHILLIIITLGIWLIYFTPYYQAANVNYYLHLTKQNIPNA